MAATNSQQVRSDIVRALELDLVGPSVGDELENEVLPQAPSRWYLTGFLAPTGAKTAVRTDETAQEELDLADESGGADDANTPDTAAAKRAIFPSSMGVSVLESEAAESLSVTVSWGDYRLESVDGASLVDEVEKDESDLQTETAGDLIEEPGREFWRREQREEKLQVELPPAAKGTLSEAVPNSGGLDLVVTVRPVGERASIEGGVPAGTRSVAIFLVNNRPPAEDHMIDQAYVFQVELIVESETPFVARPDLRGLAQDEWDERVADLQYHDLSEFAVGHGVAVAWDAGSGSCRTVQTTWIPTAKVLRIAPAETSGVELHMEALGVLRDGDDAARMLGPLVDQYRSWIEDQENVLQGLGDRRRETGEELLRRASHVAGRISKGIEILQDADALEAFKVANRAMAAAARRREAERLRIAREEVDTPQWRQFQLAFILMNLTGIFEPINPDRDVVDLLFFPTGGGKTEAYLGLAAFTLVLRRIRNPGRAGGGVSVLMRYTLRLLTLDQLGRAAALICALELERERAPERLGSWPFEIGLWVGRAATPNRLGSKSDNDPESARRKTIAFKNDTRKPSPIPLEDCPWCHKKFSAGSFELTPNSDQPTDLLVRCVNPKCEFSKDRALPIVGVDEPIYRRLPCFVIATVDKFAAMPWTGQVGAFFGHVERFDEEGYYGPSNPDRGRALESPLHPPDLIIQDELHLISGPLGTMVGLYETAIDALSTRDIDGKQVLPKVVASTATVRQAPRQIQGLFARRLVDVFPPPGPNRMDSFFAETHEEQRSYPRLYVGVAAQGRSLKVVLLRTYLALMAAAQKAYIAARGKSNPDNPADPYMTLLGYFNSLRELGGSRRIVEDEVATRLTGYGGRKRIGEKTGLFANRKIAYEVVELTSRVGTNQIAAAKRRLAQPFSSDEHIDVALATNMISVGLDITRLGLMVVLGQPKTSAEYIQATSRVGRDHEKPGLIVTLLNLHRPRDRSHYERFPAYHQTFYRSVEASGVTPFSPRALDRGLAATAVALARLGSPSLTPPLGAGEILSHRGALGYVGDALAARARNHTPLDSAEATRLANSVKARVEDLLDEWAQIARDYHDNGVPLQYQDEVGSAQRLLYEFLHPELRNLPLRHWKFRANRSMRDVEPEVNLFVKTLDEQDVEERATP
jgi:hypothetical protein